MRKRVSQREIINLLRTSPLCFAPPRYPAATPTQLAFANPAKPFSTPRPPPPLPLLPPVSSRKRKRNVFCRIMIFSLLGSLVNVLIVLGQVVGTPFA